ncbi:iron donor protein CyaY [Buchnera aphidicola]|uniref:iron donor protein CyaY n=1 Tax=Buchnera aphidicola TaxID=9 RepID=UPI0022373E8B|nr:iron donor protein CyaY [Buchnera aphidicola]MCW5197434.1 iron donor protein CyaY [Buchnera aphidicola (Chaitophorus viminalis)]
MIKNNKLKIINTLKFHNLANKTFLKIEKYLDNYNGKLDIDYESNSQIIQISIEFKKEIIISKQEFLKQIWIATKYKGYYFEYINKKWFCKRNQCEIFQFINTIFINIK